MTDPTTPVDRLRAEITERLDRARAIAEPSDALPISVWEDGFEKIRRGLEAEIARSCERDLRVLDRHAPTGNGECCRYCCPGEHTRLALKVPFPCPDLADLADEYGVDLTGGTDG